MPLLDDPTVNERTWLDDAGRLGSLIVRGSRLPTDVVQAVTEATLSMSTSEVTQLELTVSDPDLTLLASELFSPGGTNRAGSRLDYGDLPLEVAAVELVDGAPLGLKVTARSLGTQRLRRARGYKVRQKVSPTEWIAVEAKAAGLRFVGQATSDRRSIARGKDETSWDTCQRLAQELGFICFEVNATLYFGRPTWLVEQANHELRIGWDGEGTDPRIVGAPACRRTGDDPVKVATVSIGVLGELGDDVLVGHKFVLDGIPTFDGAYLIDAVTIPLVGDQPVAISASTAVNPTPQPPSAPGKGKSSTSAGGGGVKYVGGVSIPATGRLTVKGVKASRDQLANATTIYKVGSSMGIDHYGIQIALAAAIQESVLHNLSYGDRDSIGLFQQRNSWGSYATRHDPAGAARLFFNALKRVPGWHSKSVASAAQAVQRSAYPSAYARWAGEAKRLVDAIAATRKVVKTTGGSKSPSGGPRATGGHSAGAFVAIALKQAGKRYIYGAEASPSDPNPRAFDCSELVQWACARVGVRFVDGSSAQRAACRTVSLNTAIHTRGALLFHPGHVAISLGNGRTIEAANSHVGVVSYSAYNRFSSGGLIPGIAY